MPRPTTTPAPDRSRVGDGEPARGGAAAGGPSPRGRLPGWALGAAVVVALALVPFGIGEFTVSLLARILIFGLLAASLDLLVGVTGMASLGHAAYFGVGAYTGGLVAVHLTDIAPVQLLAGLVAGGLAAAATGWVAVRTRGVYFLMLTLAVAQIVFSLAVTWTSVTGGSNGLAGIPPPRPAPGAAPMELEGFVYWYVLAAVGAVYWLLRRVVLSPFGRALRGIHANEQRMRAVGYRTAWYKLAVFTIAGAAAGAAGSLLTTHERFVSPGDIAFDASALALIMVVVGGTGTLHGGFLGAAVVVVVREVLASYVTGHGLLLLGVVFVLVVYMLPRGVVGGVRALLARRRGRAARAQAGQVGEVEP